MSEQFNQYLEKLKENPKKIHEGDDGFKYHNAVEEKGDVIPLQELNNITDQRTFDEIVADEKEQWRVMHTKLKEHRCDSEMEAKQMVDNLLIYVFHRHGASPGWRIKQGPCTWAELEKRLYKDFRIRVSRHRKSQGDEIWEAGYYVYVDKELVAFISTPERFKGEMILTVPFWLVRTNVQLPGGKGLIH